jgi:hypothetical protein
MVRAVDLLRQILDRLAPWTFYVVDPTTTSPICAPLPLLGGFSRSEAKVLSKVFRGKFTASLKNAFRRGALQFPGTLQAIGTDRAFRAFLRTLFRKNWVVYAKPPFRGPEHLLQYLARYTHRVAISNHRIVNVADGQVTFRWKDC